VACQTENQVGMLESCASWSATCCALQAGQFINANHIRENRRIRCDRSQNSRCTASRRTDQPGGACFEGRPVGLADYIDDGLGSGDDGSAAQRSASPSINFRLDERVPKKNCSGAAVLVDCKSCSSPTTARSVGHRLIQMLIVGYCYGLRSERRFSNVVRGISEEVSATLASRLFDCGINAGEQIRLQAQDR
jgi:hypothetical protein